VLSSVSWEKDAKLGVRLDVYIRRVTRKDNALANIFIFAQYSLEYVAGHGDALGCVAGRGHVLGALPDVLDADGAVFGVILPSGVVDHYVNDLPTPIMHTEAWVS
jgi:hypothetical protein